MKDSKTADMNVKKNNDICQGLLKQKQSFNVNVEIKP